MKRQTKAQNMEMEIKARVALRTSKERKRQQVFI